MPPVVVGQRGEIPAGVWQAQFLELVHDGTGIPRLVIRAWILAEGGPRTNPLNIGPGRNYASHIAAANATVELLRTSRYAPILRAAAGGDDRAVLEAIIRSPWDAGHYAGAGGSRAGTLLYGTYARAKEEGFSPSDVLEFPGEIAENVRGVLEPVERAVHSAQEWLERKAKVALAYVGLTALALVLAVFGLERATGIVSAGASAAGARRGARGAEDPIPF